MLKKITKTLSMWWSGTFQSYQLFLFVTSLSCKYHETPFMNFIRNYVNRQTTPQPNSDENRIFAIDGGNNVNSCSCECDWMAYYKHDDVIKWKHFPRYWPFARGIHRSPVNSPYKGQRRGALMFSVISVQINGWVNNREAGDLRCIRLHYDVTVM